MFIYSACSNSILCQRGGGLPISDKPVSFSIDGKAITASTTLSDNTGISLRTAHPIYTIAVNNSYTTSDHYIGIQTEADAVLLIVNAFMVGAVVDVPGMNLESLPTISSGSSDVFPLQISTEFTYSASELACTSSDHSDCIKIVATNASYKRFGLQIIAIPLSLS